MMPYLVEFMKFLCGFGLILAVSLTLLYFISPETASLAGVRAVG